MIRRIKDTPFSGIFFAILSGLATTLSSFLVQLAIKSTRNPAVYNRHAVESTHNAIVSTDRVTKASDYADQFTRQPRLTGLEITLIRSFEQLVIVTPLLFLFKSRLWVTPDRRVYLILMSIFGYLNVVFFYCALDRIPLSDGLALSFTCPFFAAIFSYAILKEKCHWLDLLCGLLSLSGVTLIAQPTFIFGKRELKDILFHGDVISGTHQGFYLAGVGYSLLYSVSLALYFVLIRQFTNQSDHLINIFYPSLLGCIATPAVMLLSGKQLVIPDSSFGISCLFSVGVLTSMGLGCLAFSLQLENATVVSLMRNMDVLYVDLLQYVVMNALPTWWSIGGAVVIVLVLVILIFKEDIISNLPCASKVSYEIV